jgi:3-oxoacyl-[acyl-carrier protein] reductase
MKRPTISAEGQLAGAVAIVTGGSSGIGAATVRRLAEAGAAIVIGYNKGEARAKALMAELPGSGHRTLYLPMEDTAAIRAVAVEVERAYGRADILVNSAGFTRAIPHADLEALDDATIDAIFAANVRGPFATIRAFAPLLRKTGGAVIVNISSVAGFMGQGSNIAYAGSKAALDTMTMSLARVLGPEIRVVCVSPGAVDTDFVPGRGRAQIERQAQASPMKTVIEPDDVALAVMACVTHLPFTTGSRIVVNGGSHL